MNKDEQFDKIWSAYPKRKGTKGKKDTARLSVIMAIEKHGYDSVFSAVTNYKAECERKGSIGTPFVKQFIIWLNCGRGVSRVKGSFLGVEHYCSAENKGIDRKWASIRYKALKASNGKCCLCGRGASDGVSLHVDHIKPKSKYPELKYELSNLQVLCEDCNIGKSNEDETDWR